MAPRGRPRVYATDEERREQIRKNKRESKQRATDRLRQQQLSFGGPAATPGQPQERVQTRALAFLPPAVPNPDGEAVGRPAVHNPARSFAPVWKHFQPGTPAGSSAFVTDPGTGLDLDPILRSLVPRTAVTSTVVANGPSHTPSAGVGRAIPQQTQPRVHHSRPSNVLQPPPNPSVSQQLPQTQPGRLPQGPTYTIDPTILQQPAQDIADPGLDLMIQSFRNIDILPAAEPRQRQATPQDSIAEQEQAREFFRNDEFLWFPDDGDDSASNDRQAEQTTIHGRGNSASPTPDQTQIPSNGIEGLIEDRMSELGTRLDRVYEAVEAARKKQESDGRLVSEQEDDEEEDDSFDTRGQGSRRQGNSSPASTTLYGTRDIRGFLSNPPSASGQTLPSRGVPPQQESPSATSPRLNRGGQSPPPVRSPSVNMPPVNVPLPADGVLPRREGSVAQGAQRSQPNVRSPGRQGSAALEEVRQQSPPPAPRARRRARPTQSRTHLPHWFPETFTRSPSPPPRLPAELSSVIRALDDDDDPAILPPPIPSLAQRLVGELRAFPSCSGEAHQRHHGDEHLFARHGDIGTSLQCYSLEDITTVLRGERMPAERTRCQHHHTAADNDHGSESSGQPVAGRSIVRSRAEARRDRRRREARRRLEDSGSEGDTGEDTSSDTAMADDDDGEDDAEPEVGLPSGPPLPSVLADSTRSRIGLPSYPSGLNCQQAFEGSASNGVPPRLCLECFYDTNTASATIAKSIVSFDIDAILGPVSSLAVATQGLLWIPDYKPNLNLTADIHLRMAVAPPVPIDEEDRTLWEYMPLHKIPHCALAQVTGWSGSLLYAFFPRMRRLRSTNSDLPNRRPPAPSGSGVSPDTGGDEVRYDADVQMGDGDDVQNDGERDDGALPDRGSTGRPSYRQQRQRIGVDGPLKESLVSSAHLDLWFDEILRPAMESVITVVRDDGVPVPDPNILAYFPASRRWAMAASHSAKESSRRLPKDDVEDAQGGNMPSEDSNRSRTLFLTVPLQPRYLAPLQRAIETRIQDLADADPAKYNAFRDFQLFFDTKNTKTAFMHSAGLSGDRSSAAAKAATTAAFRECTAHLQHILENTLDPEFYDQDTFYIDLGKQVTSGYGTRVDNGGDNTGNPHERRDDSGQAETYLWRTCCLSSRVTAHRRWTANTAVAQAAAEVKSQGVRWFARDTGREGSAEDPAVVEDQFAYTEEVLDLAASYQKPPTVTYYQWATVAGCGSVTITPAQQSIEQNAGLVYTQLYGVIKAPFDAAGHYVFTSTAYEHLALDPIYLRQLRSNGRAVITSIAAAKNGYIRSKSRAAGNLADIPGQSFGIREEHRLSLRLFRQVVDTWPTEPESDDVAGMGFGGEDIVPLPWFTIPTRQVVDFLTAQINRHCLLFEYLYAKTGLTVSLPETVAMVAALRGLRYCYSGALLHLQPLLFGTKWEQREDVARESEAIDVRHPPFHRGRGRGRGSGRGRSRGGGGSGSRGGGGRVTSRRGLGMFETMTRHGFGWWVPDLFRWPYWRFKADVTSELLVGNFLVHREYRRRAAAIRDVLGVQLQIFQWDEWFTECGMEDPFDGGRPSENVHPRIRGQRRTLWLDVLTCIVIRWFDLDVWERALEENKKYPEIRPQASAAHDRRNPPRFCFEAMRHLFFERDAIEHDPDGVPPHFVAGNRQSWHMAEDLVRYLFTWKDRRVRRGWGVANFRVAAELGYQAVVKRMGEDTADEWFESLLKVVLATHWILPWPSPSSLLDTTKNNRSKGQTRRTMWATVRLRTEATEELVRSHDNIDLDNRKRRASQELDGDGTEDQPADEATAEAAVGLRVNGRPRRPRRNVSQDTPCPRMFQIPRPAQILFDTTGLVKQGPEPGPVMVVQCQLGGAVATLLRPREGPVPREPRTTSGELQTPFPPSRLFSLLFVEGRVGQCPWELVLGRVSLGLDTGRVLPVVESGLPPVIEFADRIKEDDDFESRARAFKILMEELAERQTRYEGLG